MMKTIFLKSKKVNLKKRMWLCHATIIRGLDILLVTRGENIICQVKKNEYAWCSLVAWWNRAWHQLACKNCQSTSFLKVTKLSFKMFKNIILPFLAKISIRNSFLLSYLRFMIRCKEQEIGFEKRMSCSNYNRIRHLVIYGGENNICQGAS